MGNEKKESLVFKNSVSNILMESYVPMAVEKGTPTSYIGSFSVNDMATENSINQNMRLYPSNTYSSKLALGKGGKFIDEAGKVRPMSLLGSLDHPLDDRAEMRLEEACVVWYDIEESKTTKGSWNGKAHILNTERGRILKTLLDYLKENSITSAGLLGVSSRALGLTEEKHTEDGLFVECIIPESFELKSFDVVYEPSFSGAKLLLENKHNKKDLKTLTESVRSLGKELENEKAFAETFANKIEESIEALEQLEKVEEEKKVLVETKKGVKENLNNKETKKKPVIKEAEEEKEKSNLEKAIEKYENTDLDKTLENAEKELGGTDAELENKDLEKENVENEGEEKTNEKDGEENEELSLEEKVDKLVKEFAEYKEKQEAEAKEKEAKLEMMEELLLDITSDYNFNDVEENEVDEESEDNEEGDEELDEDDDIYLEDFTEEDIDGMSAEEIQFLIDYGK